ncbi:MAG TPA: YbdD/YjiX family protein [Povalibacter sp.]
MSTRLRVFWNFLRALATDDAYERYCEHHRESHTHSAPLTRRAFYLREQQRKWSGVQRCC